MGHKHITVEDLPVQKRVPYGFARVLRGVLTQDQCAALIASINTKGFTPVLLNIGNDEQQLEPETRDGHRCIVDSPEVASWLLEAIRPYLPEVLSDGAEIVDLNERCRFLCYTPGQFFEGHLMGDTEGLALMRDVEMNPG